MPFGVWEGGFLKRLFRQGRALQKTGFIRMRNACDVKGFAAPPQGTQRLIGPCAFVFHPRGAHSRWGIGLALF